MATFTHTHTVRNGTLAVFYLAILAANVAADTGGKPISPSVGTSVAASETSSSSSSSMSATNMAAAAILMIAAFAISAGVAVCIRSPQRVWHVSEKDSKTATDCDSNTDSEAEQMEEGDGANECPLSSENEPPQEMPFTGTAMNTTTTAPTTTTRFHLPRRGVRHSLPPGTPLPSEHTSQGINVPVQPNQCPPRASYSLTPAREAARSSLIQTLEMVFVDENNFGPLDDDIPPMGGGNDDDDDDESLDTKRSRQSASTFMHVIFDDASDNCSSSFNINDPDVVAPYSSYGGKNMSKKRKVKTNVDGDVNDKWVEEAWMEFQHCSALKDENGSVSDIMDAWKQPAYQFDRRWKSQPGKRQCDLSEV